MIGFTKNKLNKNESNSSINVSAFGYLTIFANNFIIYNLNES